jgi:hypothetical protein
MEGLMSSRVHSWIAVSLLACSFLMLQVRIAGATPLYPPMRFDHAYKGKLIERSGSVHRVREECAGMGFHSSLACSSGDKNGTCTIWLPEVGSKGPFRLGTITVTDNLRSGLRRHEIAHCNGWQANHPS